MAVFIGLDLAWTVGRETGVCVLEGDECGLEVRRAECMVGSPEEFADLCVDARPDVVVGVDAPLIVGDGRRAERELNRVFGRYRAGAYAANAAWLAGFGGEAGPRLGELLRKRGFNLDPGAIAPRARGWHALEVYPHAAHVRLFGLEQRMAYKRGPVAARRLALALYQGHLREECERRSAGLGEVEALAEVLADGAVEARGRELKRLEDQLDAVTCALVAHHAWLHGSAGLEVYGDMRGYIAVPRS
jgi:predicted RNase H-like nuclease